MNGIIGINGINTATGMGSDSGIEGIGMNDTDSLSSVTGLHGIDGIKAVL